MYFIIIIIIWNFKRAVQTSEIIADVYPKPLKIIVWIKFKFIDNNWFNPFYLKKKKKKKKKSLIINYYYLLYIY